MGYIAMSAKKSKETPEFFAPLSYGRGNEPEHNKLLRRGRATIFATEVEAWRMLEGTLRQAKKDGDEWTEKFQYAIIEVVANDEVDTLKTPSFTPLHDGLMDSLLDRTH